LNTLAELGKNLVFIISQWSSRVLVGMKIEGNYWIILDIVVVAFIIYWFLSRILESKAVRILYGFIILIALLLLGHFLNLLILNWFLKYLSLMLIIAIPIIFQSEIRSALDKLGRIGMAKNSKFSKGTLAELLSALKFLVDNKIGATIVIEKKVPLKEYTKSGHNLYADVSKELIISIFSPNSLLHDGAVIISGDKIITAGCMLPVPEEKDLLGARHRVAKYLSTETDAVILVISEERGTLSLALDGELEQNLTIEEINKILVKIFRLS